MQKFPFEFSEIDAGWYSPHTNPLGGLELSAAFTAWLDEQLEGLEERFRDFWTTRSLATALIAHCYPRT
jgi:hypothetical protein